MREWKVHHINVIHRAILQHVPLLPKVLVKFAGERREDVADIVEEPEEEPVLPKPPARRTAAEKDKSESSSGSKPKPKKRPTQTPFFFGAQADNVPEWRMMASIWFDCAGIIVCL